MVYITPALIYGYIHTLKPDCVIITNASNTYQVTDVFAYEVPPAAGNKRPLEYVVSIRTDGDWFYNFDHVHNVGQLVAAATINDAIAQANTNSCTLCLALTPDTAGVIPAYQVAHMLGIGP